MKTTFWAAISVLLLLTQRGRAQHNIAGGAKVLLLSGGQRDHHAYRRQSNLLQKLLEGTRQFEVTICEDAALLETPALQKYDVVMAMADRRDPEHRLTEGQQRALLKFVHDGKGFVSFHAFCCADPSWVPEMRALLGGTLAHFGTPNTKVQMGKFSLKIISSEHPITKGVADFEHEDELYYYLQTQGELQPLMVAGLPGQGMARPVDPHLRDRKGMCQRLWPLRHSGKRRRPAGKRAIPEAYDARYCLGRRERIEAALTHQGKILVVIECPALASNSQVIKPA